MTPPVPVRNIAIYAWDTDLKTWKFYHRYETIKAASMDARLQPRSIIIDLVTGRTVWRAGEFLNRKRPASLATLEAVEVQQVS